MLRRRPPATVALVLSLSILGGSVAAQDRPRRSEAQLPPGIDAEFQHLERTADEEVVLSGEVTIYWEGSRFQADKMTFREQRYVEAEGNVLVVWGENRLFGTRMSYDLELDRGTIESAIGQVAQDFLFWAKSVEKIGADTVHVKRGRVTTCTQPTPYWSFLVSSATIRIEGYARMWNVVLKAWKLPIFYLPYLVWPVKRERAAGLLFPQFGNTSQRGRFYSQDVFIPLGRSADLTLQGRYYTEAGFGFGAEARFIPNREGAGSFSGFVINDQVTARDPTAKSLRYAYSYRQTQQFKNGFRMIADVNDISDPNFYADYARDIELVSTPVIQTRVEFSRNGPWTSMNAREFRREQLLAGGTSLVQQTLPEIEWRGRSRKLGKTPLYLTYEASFAQITQRGTLFNRSINADYLRGDLFPTITFPWTPAAWIDINPQVAYRFTYYTQRDEPITLPNGAPSAVVVDDSLDRNLWRAGVDIIGPKIYKIYGGKQKGDSSYKHSFEPRISYFAGNEFEEQNQIILFDEIDRFSVAGNRATYALITRLFAKRARSRAQAPLFTETVLLPDGTRSAPAGQEPVAGPLTPPSEQPQEDAPQEPVEMASLELRQSRAFDRDLSTADKDGDGQIDDTSQFSSLQLIGRYNPNPMTSIDLRSSFNVLFTEFSDFTISGTVRRQLAQVRFSLVHRNGLGLRPGVDEETGAPIVVPNDNDTQLRLTTGFNMVEDRLQLYFDGTLDADPPPGRPHLPSFRWRVQYRTQCCTFLVERLIRDYQTNADREDWYFRIDLKGVGKLLDFKY